MKLVLVLIALTSFANCYAQLPFSFERKILSEETSCFSLPHVGSELSIEEEMIRFLEDPIQRLPNREIFRIVTYGERGDPKTTVIRRIERVDSFCVVSMKYVRNARKKEVFFHSKTYELSKWTEFKELLVRSFWEASESATKVYYHEGVHERYEFVENGQYKLLEGTNANPDIVWLLDYHEYLISPIFDDDCDARRRKINLPHTAQKKRLLVKE